MMTSAGILSSQAGFLAASVGDATLPIMASGSEPSEGGGEGGGLRTPPFKILIAEDNPALLRAASRAFTGTFVSRIEDVVMASNVPEAIAAFDREGDAIRAVLSDMMMPGGGPGIDLYRHVRRSRTGIPFAFWSGGIDKVLEAELEAIMASDSLVTFFDKLAEMSAVTAWFRSTLMASGGG